MKDFAQLVLNVYYLRKRWRNLYKEALAHVVGAKRHLKAYSTCFNHLRTSTIYVGYHSPQQTQSCGVNQQSNILYIIKLEM